MAQPLLQQDLFESLPLTQSGIKKGKSARSGTFGDNMKLPVHRWFRYSAGFSADWAKEVISQYQVKHLLDPFMGSGTVCLVGDELGLKSWGVEAHPFVYKLAKGKLAWAERTDDFKQAITDIENFAVKLDLNIPDDIPRLLTKCYSNETLLDLYRLRDAYTEISRSLSEEIRSLVFLAISAILRPVSHVGTAQWQYILPNKRKAKVLQPIEALNAQVGTMVDDMQQMSMNSCESKATIIPGDARTLIEIPADIIDLVVTSPPYANNYDYADATRLEMTFWGEVRSWGDLHGAVRQFLMRSSSQHVSKDRLELESLLNETAIEPIKEELTRACHELEVIREGKGGKKAYHTMIAAYFNDMSNTFHSLRRVTKKGCTMCFVIGDSAPYGIYVPVEKWLGELAIAANFSSWSFEKIRDRNIKWKNRKHSVPLHEGRLWIKG